MSSMISWLTGNESTTTSPEKKKNPTSAILGLERQVIEVTFVQGPLGLRLRHENHQRIKVHNFELDDDSRQGPVELCGEVRIGDELTAVNAQQVDGTDFKGTVLMLRAAYWPITLRFARVASDMGPVAQGQPGGKLLEFSGACRQQIADKNDLIIRKAADLDNLILQARQCVESQSKGSVALARELSLLPYVRQSLRTLNSQVQSVSEAIERVETLLSAKEESMQARSSLKDNGGGCIDEPGASSFSSPHGSASSYTDYLHIPPAGNNAGRDAHHTVETTPPLDSRPRQASLSDSDPDDDDFPLSQGMMAESLAGLMTYIDLPTPVINQDDNNGIESQESLHASLCAYDKSQPVLDRDIFAEMGGGGAMGGERADHHTGRGGSLLMETLGAPTPPSQRWVGSSEGGDDAIDFLTGPTTASEVNFSNSSNNNKSSPVVSLTEPHDTTRRFFEHPHDDEQETSFNESDDLTDIL